MDPIKVEGVVIENAAEVVDADAPVKLSEMAEGELSPQELELAVKVGTVVDDKAEPKKEEPKKEEVKAEELAAKPEVQEAFEDPEKEEALLKDFNSNEKGLYRKMKKENTKRRSAETERDHTLMRLKVAEDKAKRLEEENVSLKTKPKEVVKEELDAFGNAVKKEVEVEKPLTRKDLEDLKKKEDEEKAKEAEANQDKVARAQKITSILDSQEQDLLAEHEDAAEALTLADKIYKAAASQSLDGIFTSGKQRSKALKLCVDFFHATANADKFKDDDYSAADVAYELGKMHPYFGKKKDGAASSKADGGLSPDKTKKLVENASRRPSSASVTAGGDKNFVPYEEMTYEQLAGLPDSEFAKVPRAVREKLMMAGAA